MKSHETEDLTDRQKEVLGKLKDFIEENGYPPILEELADSLGMRSPRSVYSHLLALEKKGYIKRDRTCRGIKIL